jgi:hypothetical protein
MDLQPGLGSARCLSRIGLYYEHIRFSGLQSPEITLDEYIHVCVVELVY